MIVKKYRGGGEMRQLRLLREPDFRLGAANMAIDCAIMEAAAASQQPPTLRLYGWTPFCLSLGYGQRLSDVDLRALEENGWHLVRRPTGGKAILHGGELTYSLCLPADHPLLTGSVVDSYQRIGRALLRGLQELGLPASSRPRAGDLPLEETGPVCFQAPSHYEITFGGRKLIGSAQMRRKHGVLQHGTLPLRGDVALICDALHFDTPRDRERQKERVRLSALTLAEALGRETSWDEVADALQAGFSQELGMQLQAGELSRSETRRALDLLAERFGNPDFTAKR